MEKIKNFENEKLIIKTQKILDNFNNMSSEEIAKDVYKFKLYVYACGQAGYGHYNWLKGAEYMMAFTGFDVTELKNEVMQKIEAEKRTIVNGELFLSNEWNIKQ